MSDAIAAGSGKPRKRVAAKAVGEQTAKKVKSTIHLSREADQRLNIHCAMMGYDRSEMVERLINEQLRRFVVSDRGGPGGGVASDDAA